MTSERLNELYRQIFWTAPVGMTVYDSSGACIAANNAICDLIGATHEQVLDQNFHHIQSWQRSGLLDKALEAQRTGLPTRLEISTTTTFGREISAVANFLPFVLRGDDHLLFTLARRDGSPQEPDGDGSPDNGS